MLTGTTVLPIDREGNRRLRWKVGRFLIVPISAQAPNPNVPASPDQRAQSA
jgi:hypothetical protein